MRQLNNGRNYLQIIDWQGDNVKKMQETQMTTQQKTNNYEQKA